MPTAARSVYEFDAVAIDGTPVPLSSYRDRVLLVVNVASRCGYTPQYRGLEALYRRHRSQGFLVLGFPCDQFGRQEPGTDAEIDEFCTRTYGVTFPMFGKIKVNGSDAHPLYRLLKAEKKGWLGSERIKWNFTKFLVDRQGQVIGRFAPTVTPESIEKHVVAALSSAALTT